MQVFIGVGSNLGEPARNIDKAKELLLSCRDITFVKSSSLYETEPWGLSEQPRFVNAVWLIETDLSPSGLFVLLKDIESRMGRKKVVKYGPRVIDLDILFYGNIIYQDSNLTIPHPRISERSFVLFPLCEIAPDFVHPVKEMKVSLLREKLDNMLDIRKIL